MDEIDIKSKQGSEIIFNDDNAPLKILKLMKNNGYKKLKISCRLTFTRFSKMRNKRSFNRVNKQNIMGYS